MIASIASSSTSPLSMVSGWVIGGAVSRIAQAATAVGERGVGYELRLVAVWHPGDPDLTGIPRGCATDGRLSSRTPPVNSQAC